MHRAGIPGRPRSTSLRLTLPGRRLAPLPLCLFALLATGSAQQPSEQPNIPIGQAPIALPANGQAASGQTPTGQAASAPGSVSGTVTDSGGGAIPNARITLTRSLASGTQPPTPAPEPLGATSNPDGLFTFSSVPPGPFTLSVSANGFAPRETSGQLQPGEDLELAAIVLTAATATSVQVTASQADIADAQIGEEEKQRVLGVIPNYYVSYVSNPVPLDPSQKFQLAFKTLIDPVSLVLTGIAAGAQQATDTYAWGEGAQGYAKRYSAAYGNFLTSDMLGDAVLPILFRQDPRYFYKGTGSIRSRLLYAAANAVICKGDNHRWQVNYSAILGGLASGALANLYYPAPDRTGAALTFEGAGIGTAISAAGNIFQEFLIHHLTPHIPPKAPPGP